jgi:uroporphyrinogen-III decarboxylase
LAQPLLRALGGEAVWPPSPWLTRSAGRYLPEHRTVRAEAGDFIALCTTLELAAEVTLQPIRRYGLDAAVPLCLGRTRASVIREPVAIDRKGAPIDPHPNY